MKKSELYGYVCHFSVDYDSIDVDNILDIHSSNTSKTKRCCKNGFLDKHKKFFHSNRSF